MPERELDERFHLNLEDIKDFAVFRVDPEGRIASWNTGAERVKGYKAAEAIGQPFAMLFTQEDREAGQPEQEMRVASEKGVYQGEGLRVRKGGDDLRCGGDVARPRGQGGCPPGLRESHPGHQRAKAR